MNDLNWTTEAVMEDLEEAIEISKAFSAQHGVEFDGSITTAIEIAKLIAMARSEGRERDQNIDVNDALERLNKTLEEGLHSIYLEL